MPKQAPSVYLLAGTEQFLKEEHLNRIKSSFLDKESAIFNCNVFYASTPNAVEEILECVHTAPFLGQKRIVLLRQVEQLSVLDKERVLSYIRSTDKFTLLILETTENNLRQGFYAQISKFAQVIFCQPLKGSQLDNWLKMQVEARGKKITEAAKHLLVDNLGNNLVLLSNALVNLILYLGERPEIQVSDVQRLTGPDMTSSAFELYEMIIAGNSAKALQIMEGLLQDGINSAQILGALAHKIIAEKNKMDSSHFLRFLQKLQRTDADIKTGRQRQNLALELLLVRLLHPDSSG